MKREYIKLLLVIFGILLCSCKKQSLVADVTEKIEIGETRSHVEDQLNQFGLKFERNSPVQDASSLPDEIVQEEALTSYTIIVFISDPTTNAGTMSASTKTTRVIIVFDQNGRVAKVMTRESNLSL